MHWQFYNISYGNTSIANQVFYLLCLLIGHINYLKIHHISLLILSSVTDTSPENKKTCKTIKRKMDHILKLSFKMWSIFLSLLYFITNI